MAKKVYVGVDNISRQVKKMYIGGASDIVKRDLPVGYTQITHIESNGNQYIDTGVVAPDGFVVEMDAMITKYVNYTCLIGSEDAGPNYNCNFVRLSDNNQWGLGACLGLYGGNVSLNTLYKIDASTIKGNSYLNVNGEVVLSTNNADLRSSDTLALFCNHAGGGYGAFVNARIYFCKIKVGGVLLRDYVACINTEGVAGFYDFVENKFKPSEGAEDFVAGPVVSEYVARRVKKGYIGIGGVARPFISGALEYYGAITPLSVGRQELSAASIGEYALFAGGSSSSGTAYSTVDAYNTSLIRSTPTALSQARNLLSSATVGEYALFAGGLKAGGTPYYSTVDAYNLSLTRSTPAALSNTKYLCAAGTVGNYALFAGGYGSIGSYTYTTVVDAYNGNLTKTNPTGLSLARSHGACGATESYALIAGGLSSGNNRSAVVDAYNTSLTRSVPSALSAARSRLAGARAGSYVLIAGGHNTSGASTKIVDAYDENLTRSTLEDLSSAKATFAGATLENSALFGSQGSTDVYDENLTRSTCAPLSVSRYALSATTVGKYALFAGGYSNSSYRNEVDAFVLD